jgi:leader peptidase (prepilin peptidase)/N-methyltransferase
MPAFLLASFEAATGVPEWLAYVFAFVLGACIGSFLNVVIYRVPEEKSLMTPSACPKCGKSIPLYYNIPVLGWLILGGRCANCKAPISARYPAIELLTALLFVLTFWQVGWNAFLPAALVFVATMVALIFIDADHMILPNVITYPLFVLAVIVRIAYPLAFGYTFADTQYWPMTLVHGQPAWLVSLAGALLGAVVGGGSLWLFGALWKLLRGVDAMGLGDVKMMLGVGALLGWRLSLLTIFAGAFAGSLIGIVVLSRQKDKTLQAQIPFGIFLGTGAIIAMLFGERMIGWYLAKFM